MTVIVGLTSSSRVSAQAFCALRDPITSIYGFFPGADSHRSIVKVVGNNAKIAIGERLPLDLHFNELGKHTIYVAMNDDDAIGIVHARSEGDLWGLTEIVWALDMDLQVVDFSFQRCRNPARRSLEESSFRSQIRGKSFSELRDLLTPGTEGFRPNTVSVPTEANDLALTVAHSALKTIVVTETVWQSELRSLRLNRMLNSQFDQPVQVANVPMPYTPAIEAEIGRQLLTDGTGIGRSQLTMSRISDEADHALGYLVEAPWKSGSTEAQLRWLIDREGQVLDVTANGLDVKATLRNSLGNLVGFEPSSAAHCANALELTAFEVALLAREHNVD